MNLLVLNGSRVAASTLLFQKLAQKSPSPSLLFKTERLAYKPIQFAFNAFARKSYSTVAPINMNASNLTKDVIVYKYNNPRYFKFLNIFALVQFVFWTGMVELQMSTLRDAPIDENAEGFNEQPFYKKHNLGSDRYKYGISAVFLFVGECNKKKINRMQIDSINLNAFICFFHQQSLFSRSLGCSHWKVSDTWFYEKVAKQSVLSRMGH